MVALKSTVLAIGFSTIVAAQYGGSGSTPSSSVVSSAPSAPAAAIGTATNGVIDVKVGANNVLQFSPSTVMASVGDQIRFHFYPLNHSVVESSFSSPCTYKQGGIYSGWFPVSSGADSQMFTVTVNDTNPHWLFCSQTVDSHCQKGMVMVINPSNSTSKTLDAYKTLAAGTKTSISGATVMGGVSQANIAPSSSSSAASSPTASASGNAAADTVPLNWFAMGTGLTLSSLWALLMI